ncbi:alcohol dehydrogenase [Rhodobium orientis]|uniref:Alcohol dehydrogenase 2 n=1 Tax=Rhodobium orientis TaxID=34017 RepID=A0A327JPT2_9HYPH|nr:iron-containing alcohol dehydrogenase [Rhodobium orientis]MBB4304875.1 alcohol dehydrogenase [Rhodobium orientis]MBK5949204.1 lactaldehyde reductase [Rhodobium orientis]RAI27373.1 lactaldehyde reductase [Rhodobium orientis]
MLQKRTFVMPAMSLLGPGVLADAGPEIVGLGLKKALVVSDQPLASLGLVKKITDMLDANGIAYAVFDKVMPNPTCKCVEDGTALYRAEGCDFIVSLGGGSPQDAAKAIGILAANGGDIRDYEGIHKSKLRTPHIIAFNTTAGTASEVTINYVITDETRHIKMVMVDKNCLATLAVSDPELMVKKPADLTAATGMDALTHAVEAYLSIGAFELSDTLAYEAISLIAKYLKRAVDDGTDMEARSGMAWASFVAGMSFNNAGLGYVHSMAHQLGGQYDLPHGVCNAVLLPHVERFNAPAVKEKLAKMAGALGVDTTGLSVDEASAAALDAIAALSVSVGIPDGLAKLGVKKEDIPLMAANAMEDVCKGTNPRPVTVEDTIAIYEAAM